MNWAIHILMRRCVDHKKKIRSAGVVGRILAVVGEEQMMRVTAFGFPYEGKLAPAGA